MSLGDVLGISDARETLLVRAMQLALAGLLAYGVLTRQYGMATNGGLSLFVTLLPALLRREYGYSMDVGLVLWITVAIFLHSVGSLGPYGWYPWYDSVTHTVSASAIAGIGYASLRAFERHSDEIDVPPKFRAVFILVFVLAAGVVWEILEFASGQLAAITGGTAVLIVMGVDDIVSDMIFNTAGALVVATWGAKYFDDLVGFLTRRLDAENDGN